jgi:hypothetical protein
MLLRSILAKTPKLLAADGRSLVSSKGAKRAKNKKLFFSWEGYIWLHLPIFTYIWLLRPWSAREAGLMAHWICGADGHRCVKNWVRFCIFVFFKAKHWTQAKGAT